MIHLKLSINVCGTGGFSKFFFIGTYSANVGTNRKRWIRPSADAADESALVISDTCDDPKMHKFGTTTFFVGFSALLA